VVEVDGVIGRGGEDEVGVGVLEGEVRAWGDGVRGFWEGDCALGMQREWIWAWR
jgi:hypothetical protein